MDGGEKKTPFVSRLKLLATNHIGAIAPTIHFVAGATVTAAGVLGIFTFSLAPVLAIYPAYEVWSERAAPGAENATDTAHQKLEFDIVCRRNSTSNATITIRCTAEDVTGNSSQPSALNCGSHSMANLLLVQNGGTCVVANAEVTNRTRAVPSKHDNQGRKNTIFIVMCVVFLGTLLVGSVVGYMLQSFKVVKVFLSYRRVLTSRPALSAQALRGHFLAPEWLRYFRRALIVSCSSVLYHGLFALLVQYVHLPMLVWILGSWVTPACMVCLNGAMFDRAHFVRSLPDSLFEKGVVSREEIERLWQEKRDTDWTTFP